MTALWEMKTKLYVLNQVRSSFDIFQIFKRALFASLLLISYTLSAQVNGFYEVKSETANVRINPDKNATILHKLKKGEVVVVVNIENKEWWQVQTDSTIGYVYSNLLQKDTYKSWEKKNYGSGANPECDNVTPQYDLKLDNLLRVNVGATTDVVIKLMKKTDKNDTKGECIRVVYVRAGDVYDIKNIPEGLYFLKIAYGKDYRQKIINNKCHVKFAKNAIYKLGEQELDFYKIRTGERVVGNKVYENWKIPSFELKLSVITTFGNPEFTSNTISEEKFNQ